MCEKTMCTNELQNTYDTHILSFAEDYKGLLYVTELITRFDLPYDLGEIYMLATSTPSTQSREGKVYKLVDPRR